MLDAGLGVEHDGYQLYVSVDGTTVLDAAGGEARPGVAMEPSTITMWFSSGKVVTAIAIAQLWEEGRLGLDDRVVEYLPAFTNGKERATVRHLLTHTAGFPYADDSLHPPPWPELVQLICDAPAMWEPGTAAGYHGTSAHVILGELVRVVDGRPIAEYVAEEVFGPLGITDSYVALRPSSSTRCARASRRSATCSPRPGPTYCPASTSSTTTPTSTCARSRPATRAAARHATWAAVYEALLGGGAIGDQRVLQPTTVEAMIVCHRRGLVDQTFAGSGAGPHPKWGHEYPWGLGVALDGNGDNGSRGSSRVFGCSGAFSSVGFADPEPGLVCVIVTNGLIQLHRNEDRLAAVADAVQSGVGSR